MSEQIILLTGTASDECTHNLRLTKSDDKKTGEIVSLLINNLDLGASSISCIYRERRRVKEFFRFLKQNLIIKIFIDTSENTLLTQI